MRPVPVQPHRRAVHTTLWIHTRGQGWSRCCLLIYSAHVWTEKAARRGRQVGASFTAEPPNVMARAACYCHGNPAAVIFDFDQRQGSDKIPLAAPCSPGDRILKVERQPGRDRSR